jgi:ATP-dependent DNA helicase PIF1
MNGFAATLRNAGSFADSSNTIDLTSDSQTVNNQVAAASAQVTWNDDDFDNDSDLDLEMEYPLALPPMSAHRPPLHNVSKNLRKGESPTPSTVTTTPGLLGQPSSVLSWSSSPVEHMRAPVAGRKREDFQKGIPADGPSIQQLSSEPSIDSNPRGSKRRTLPWLKEKDEDGGIKNNQDNSDKSVDAMPCFSCGKSGHLQSNCLASKKTSASTKSTPWETTAKAVKDAQRIHKSAKQKTKATSTSTEDIQKANGTATKRKNAPMFLSDEQRKVLDLVMTRNKSVFFTGSAGTGKSVLMRSIIADLRKKYSREPDRVAVTASTGLAACNIGGVTLHSFAGIGLAKESVPELCKKILRNQKAKNRWMRTKVLIIDEISMVDGELFDKLEGIARTIKKSGQPFGGIQLVITGDFFQLPPVPDYGKSKAVKFAFDAETWSTAINETIGLTEVFRQKDPGMLMMERMN